MMPTRVAALTIALGGLAGAARGQDTTAVDTGYVEYRESPISLPLGLGLRMPSYDRVNGLTLPWGPKLETSNGRFDIDALVRYRSNLGQWDPSLEGKIRPSGSNELRFSVGRGTFTNDAWIRDDLTNSGAALFVGSDARNYYRGDRATARFATTFMGSSTSLTPFIGGLIERDWSTGSLAPTKSPWSFFGRKGSLRMRRPNPRVAKGHISSLIGGTRLEFVRGDLDSKVDAMLERSLHTSLEADCVGAPVGVSCFQPGDSFTQVTLDGRISFPTFSTQTFAFKGHTVLTGGAGIAPAQRFAYLGGAGTLATVDQLALGGDHLLYVQGDYIIPINRIQLRYIGNPFLGLRYSAGNAGVDSLPSLVQNLGIGVGAGLIRVDYTIDPARNRSPFSRKSAVTFDLSLSL
ncbi:MAG: hypothetical protein ACJ77T_01450 [Gemmatimonadaceae bacterium]